MIHILLCEDEERHVQEFIKEFGGDPDKNENPTTCGEFRIEVCRHIDKLEHRLRSDRIPDILVIDLYWPIHTRDKEEDSFRKSIDDFNEAIEKLRTEVPRNVRPRGWYYLCDDLRRDLRNYSSHLPTLLYTKAGPYVLDPDTLLKIEENDIRFLLKKDPPDLKKRKIKNIIEKIGFKNDVFISHSSVNVGVANEIKQELKNYRFKVFSSDGMRSGTVWNQEIRTNLINSRVVALIISQDSLASKWVDYEIGACWALGKTVIPACLGVTVDKVPEFIRSPWHCRSIDSKKEREEYLRDVMYHCDPLHNI